ncbi:ATP-dependent DNA helicase PIF1 [Hirsutella rhossiliensis]
MNRQPGGERKRKGRTPGGQAEGKCSRVRVGQKTPRRRELQAEDLASVLQHLEEEFAAGERLADEQTWCMPVPRARQVRTVQRFYRAFHDAGTLPVSTCKVAMAEPRHGGRPVSIRVPKLLPRGPGGAGMRRVRAVPRA